MTDEDEMLDLMIDVYKDIKLELATMRNGEWENSSMSRGQRDGTLTVALRMFELVEPCCSVCMSTKLRTINWHVMTSYIGAVVTDPKSDSFAMAWVDLMWRAAEKMMGEKIAKPF